MQIPVNEANEAKALIHELMEVVAREAKRVFVSSAEDLVQQHYCSKVGKTLELAVEDVNRTDLEWLQEELRERASTEIDYLRGFIESLVEERDEARAEVTKLRDALALSEVDVSLARTWCRICRTENRSNERSRDAHPHEARCPLARKDVP